MSDPRIAALVERAFDYRGHVTVSRRDGSALVGFVYDRGPAYVEMFDEHATTRIRVRIDEIADIALTGEDCAARAQRSWERQRGKLEPRATSVWGGWEVRPTLFVVALPLELRVVARVLGAKVRNAAAHGELGDGPAIARAIGIGGGAARMVRDDRPGLVISCGLAGGLDPSLETGHVVLASSVRDETGDALVAPEHIRRVVREALDGHVPLAEGELFCATRVAASSDDKRALARPGRLAVDLESWAIARAAHQVGVPWLALRVVIDPLDFDLPAFTAEPRASHVGAALRHALGGPKRARDLVRLARRARTALRAFEHALHRLGPVVGRLRAAEEHA